MQVVSEDEIHVCGVGSRVLEGSVHGRAERVIADGPLQSLGVFQGKVLVTTGDRGIHAVEGNTLVPWAKDVPATQLDARGDLLAACPDELVARLKDHGTPVNQHRYLGTEHSFANASLPGRIDGQAAALAFARTAVFLEKHLAD